MNRLLTRLLSTLFLIILVLAIPFESMATSSLDANNEDISQSIANNPDLSDAEKEQWAQWASEETSTRRHECRGRRSGRPVGGRHRR